jgi:hypothetical protein
MIYATSGNRHSAVAHSHSMTRFGFQFSNSSIFSATASRSRRAFRAGFAKNILPPEHQKAQGLPGA